MRRGFSRTYRYITVYNRVDKRVFADHNIMHEKIYKFGLSDIKNCINLSGVAFILGVEPKFLSQQIYKTDDAHKYKSFTIPKKNGKYRDISAPNAKLKFIQSRLSRLLYQCYFDIHGVPEHPKRILSHGFQKSRNLSIYTNANRHVGKKFVFNVDIKDFFPSYNFGRVRGFFIKNRHFELHETVATVLAQIACFQNTLPQGAPSSPIISEFITQSLDYKLQILAKRHRCSYSRYADDLTFSTSMKDFPSKIAVPYPVPELWVPGSELKRAISSSGLELNIDKVRMQHRGQRQAVTSLTVNSTVNISSYYYKGVRYCAHAMMTTGKAKASKKLYIDESDLNSHKIWGMLSHINNIKSKSQEILPLRDYNANNPAPHYLRLMGDFFHYHRIHESKKPIIVCEGKTDYIYLKEAIRAHLNDKRVKKILVGGASLPTKHGGEWPLDFVRHTRTASRLLELGGGGGSLPNFAALHLQRIKKYHAPTNKVPVIIIVDNDSQSKGMWTYIKSVTNSKTEIDGSEKYYHLGENLYVVPIPNSGKKDIYIEKLFQPSLLKERLNGKTFKIIQKKGDKLGPNEYGKTDFANKVVKAKRGHVDFSNFLPLLHNICDIIEGI